MRDKFSVFHRPAASCSPTPTTQQPSCASPTDRYRPLLSKIFQSHALNSGGVQAWGESFEHILHDKCGINVFREFLRTEFSDENIEFWLECEEFRNSSDQEDLQAKAQKIFNEFVAVQSKREINLDSNTRIQLEKELESANKYTFDQSQKRIQALMEKDSYCRFLRSDIYMAALELSRELNLTAQSHRLNDKIKASMAVFANLERASKQDYRRDSEEEGPESILTGLLPKVTSPKDMAVSSSQHTKGSNSVPSSPKQPRVTMAKSPAPIVLDA
ncbi:unnamed protein product [Calicophoron daubneyi]|uniref:RGS domain-containing protein n=1 Tax=Calicophoron daubneyi TaxID=300641 RepID=A0AAV2TWX8_CALDB